ncbi:MAG: hypothetical protein Fur0018_13390 [Anaerolineales bacterium]
MPRILPSGLILRDRYEIRHVIGQGGAGCVYLAEDTRLTGRLCAVKEVVHDHSLSETLLQQAREQFQQEALVLARLDHPNLPKVSDFFSEAQSDYLVMDFIPGKDLRTLVLEVQQRGEFLPEGEVLSWASQLADALTYLHSQNPPILHRDIKPGNLKVMPSGLLKLVDFGLVKILAADEATVTVIQGRGTALYTPLEQYGGDVGHTDVRSDVYAFGATLYHLLTGHPPVEARERFLNPGCLPSLAVFNPNISPRTERAILWAMNLHPDDRPPSVEAFRMALMGDWQPSRRGAESLPPPTLADLFSMRVERNMVGLAVLLLFLSLIFSLLR